MAQIDPPKRKHSKVIDGIMQHYDEVRHEPIVRYVPVDPRNPSYGVKAVNETLEIPIDPDIEGHTKYWQPETVLSPEGCTHSFKVVDMGTREVECELCHYPTSFHAGQNYTEENGKGYIRIKNRKYEVSL